MRDLIRSILNEDSNAHVIVSPRERMGKAKTYTQRKQKYQKGVGYKPKKSSKVTKKGVGRRNTSKTADARRILAKKHGIKRAQEKIDNKYVMDYVKVGELMDRHGYKYDRDVADWVNKKTGVDPDKRKRKKKIYSDPPEAQEDDEKKEPVVKKKVVFVGKRDESGESLPQEIKVNDKEENDFDDITIGDFDYEGVSEDDLMDYIGRLILGIIHDDERAIEFVSSEDEEFGGKVPRVSREAIIEDIGEKGYLWDRDFQSWIKPDGMFPIEGQKDEGDRSIKGRAFATALYNDYQYLMIGGDGNFLVSRKRVNEDLEEKGYSWDAHHRNWLHEDQTIGGKVNPLPDNS